MTFLTTEDEKSKLFILMLTVKNIALNKLEHSAKRRQWHLCVLPSEFNTSHWLNVMSRLLRVLSQFPVFMHYWWRWYHTRASVCSLSSHVLLNTPTLISQTRNCLVLDPKLFNLSYFAFWNLILWKSVRSVALITVIRNIHFHNWIRR